jgi:hypothetical protein
LAAEAEAEAVRLAAEAEEAARLAAEAEAEEAATKLQAGIRGMKGRQKAKALALAKAKAFAIIQRAAKAKAARLAAEKTARLAAEEAARLAARLAVEQAKATAEREAAEARAAAEREAKEREAKEIEERAAAARLAAEKTAREAAEKAAREAAEKEAREAAEKEAKAKAEEIQALQNRLKELKQEIKKSIPDKPSHLHHLNPRESDVTNLLQELLREFSYEQKPKFENYKAVVTEISKLEPDKLRNILKEFNSKIDPKKDTLSTSKKELKENLKKLLKKKFKKPVIFYILKKAIEILNTLINEATNPNEIFNVSDNTLYSINEAIASNYYIETSSEETEDEKNELEKEAIRTLFNNLITNKELLDATIIGKKIDEIIDNKLTTEDEFKSLFPDFPIPKKTNNNNRTKKRQNK